MENKKVLLRITHLKQYFPLKHKKLFVKANDDISLDIYEGETFGLVGESGCGKSTFGRVLLQLYHQTDGKTMYYGRSLYEIAPSYIADTLRNLAKEKKHLYQAQLHRDTLKKEYEDLSGQLEKNQNSELEKQVFQKYSALSYAEKEAQDCLLNITQIIGGFVVADNLEEVSKAFMVLYQNAMERHKLEMRRVDLFVRHDCLIAKAEAAEKDKKSGVRLRSKAQQLKKQITELEAQKAQKTKAFQEGEKKIEAMRAAYKGDSEFAQYEKNRDDGIDLARLNYTEMRQLRRDIQLIFQDPYSSLNPRMTVGQIIEEGLNAHHFFRKGDPRTQEYVMKTMENCGLAPYMIHRYPHQFSGGQRQRIGIARSLAVKPKFVVCDEAVSALDVSIQSQIINLLQDLKEKDHLTYLFISHDLSVVKYISDRIGVMYLGTMVELANAEDIFANPRHPYTEALLSAIPTTDVDHKQEAILLEGDIPSPINPPRGCKFHTRCRYCTEICKEVPPEFVEVAPGHFVACHHRVGHEE